MKKAILAKKDKPEGFHTIEEVARALSEKESIVADQLTVMSELSLVSSRDWYSPEGQVIRIYAVDLTPPKQRKVRSKKGERATASPVIRRKKSTPQK